MKAQRPIEKLGADLRLVVQAEIHRAGLEIYRQAKMESPVGNPKLWKRKKAPAGYVGGTFRRLWALNWFPERLRVLVGNSAAYALRLTHQGHSKQVPHPWLVPMIQRVIAGLSAKPLNWRVVVSGGGTSGVVAGGS